MYTIQFAQRAHFLSDTAAREVLEAMREQKSFVTVPIDLAADGGDHYTVTLNVSSIVALIRHRDEATAPSEGSLPSERPRLSLVN